mgnify:CR=1 FL=1
MAHFRGTIEGARGPSSRLGNKNTGLNVNAASWQGAVNVWLYEAGGVDMAQVCLRKHSNGAGVDRVLYDGPVGGGEEAAA